MTGNQDQLSLLRAVALGCFSLLAATSNAGPGSMDSTFAPTVNGPVYATAVQPDGRILLGGAFTAVNASSSRYHLARLFADGSLDTTFFNSGSGVSSAVWCLAVQTDSRIVIGGDFASVNGTARTRVARLNSSGALDGSFVPTNIITGSVLALAAQSDNKVIIGGGFSSTGFPAYNARLNADGTVDTAFSSYPNGAVNAIAIQSDGKIVIGGAFTTVNGASRYRIARLNADGSLDNTFQNSLTGASATVRCLQIQTDGKILIGGDFTTVNSTSRSYVARLTSTGALDTGFLSYPGAGASVYALAVQADSSVVIGGSFSTYASYSLTRVARLYADGTRDTSYATSGINNLAQALAVQSDGGLLIGGTFTTLSSSNQPYFGRLYGNLYPPEFIGQPVSRNTNVGATVSFSATVNNPTPSYYQWRKDGANITGATGMSYLLNNVQLGDAGSYSVFVNNSAGGKTSSNAVLNVGIAPAITGQPVSLIVTQGQSATFTVTATGTPLNYFWQKGGTFIPGATNSAYTIASVVASNAAIYTCQVSNFLGSVTSSNATLSVYSPPVITVQPVSQTVGVGSNFTVSVTATGNPAPAYQWSMDGWDIPGATNTSYSVTGAQTNDAGGYSVVLTNLFGAVTSSVANIGILYYAPTITAQPIGRTLLVGSNFTLTVTATGSAPLDYQWRKDGDNLSGANGTSYAVTSAQTNDTGAYTVVVTNVAGSKTSIVAVVNVGYSPVIVQQPQPFTNNLGTSNAFSVVVFGSEPLIYQWFKDGMAIANATNSLLPLSNLQSNQVGYYSVTVTNLYGWAASSNALLSIPGVPLPFQWQGLVAYYPFNGNANDESGSGINLENYGTGLQTDRFGIPGKCRWFDGTTYLVSSNGFPIVGNGPRTVSVWCYRTNLQFGHLVGWGENTAYGKASRLVLNSSPYNFFVNGAWSDASTVATNMVVGTGQWLNIVYTYLGDVSNVQVYANGSKISTFISSALATSWNTPSNTLLYIGADTGGTSKWVGALDDIRIYNRALSSNEVAQLYAFEADMPTITTQPQNQTVAQGGTAIFSVAATATSPLTCQWFKDGVALIGATNTTLTLTNVQPNRIGYYSVGVSNAVTGVVSANAALNISGYDFSQWQGLVAYYPFSGNANDASGNGNDGTPQGAVPTADRFGNSNSAYAFDGANDYIVCTDMNLANTATISVWAYPVGLVGSLVSKYNGQVVNCGYEFIYHNDNSLGLYAHVGYVGDPNNDIFPSGMTMLTLNSWSHCLLVLNNGEARIYLNGVLKYTQANVNPTSQNHDNVLLGRSVGGGNVFNGALDDIRIYNRALSPSEVQQLYASELQGGMWLDAQVTTNGVELSFPSAANLAYSVLYRTNLTSGLWDKLADLPVQPTNSTAQVTDPAVTNSPQRFYRVVTPPWP